MTVKHYHPPNNACPAWQIVDACDIAEHHWRMHDHCMETQFPSEVPNEHDFDRFIESCTPRTRMYRFELSSRLDLYSSFSYHEALDALVEMRSEAERRFKWFLKDPIVVWLWSQSDIKEAWKIATGRANRPETRNIAIWAQKRIEGAIQFKSKRGEDTTRFSGFWIHLVASQQPPFADWAIALTKALREYLSTGVTKSLIEERKRISEVARKALDGIEALQHLSESYILTDDKKFPRGALQQLIKSRGFLQALGEERLSNYYPLKRDDATAPERLLVARMYEVHRRLFRRPKPEAIARLLDLPLIKNKLDLRTIERICSKRRDETNQYITTIKSI